MGDRTRHGSLPSLGLRRIGWITVQHRPDGDRFTVHGIGHRSPAEVPVPVTLAERFAGAGVPVVEVTAP